MRVPEIGAVLQGKLRDWGSPAA